MIYVILAICFVAIAWYGFDASAMRRLIKQIEHSTDLVKLGLAERLANKYAKTYGGDIAMALAAAVTNEVFSEQPGNDQGKAFLQQNRALVEQELLKLREDSYICRVLTETVRAGMIVPYAKGIRTAEAFLDPLEKLQRLGILIPGGEAPSPSTFFPLANEFYLSRKQS
jgi:hypothetical protein